MTTENPLNKDPITDEAGAHPIGVGAGAGSGALAGAAIGSMAGPLGTIVGGMIGGIAGGLAGKEVAEAANPTVGGDHAEHIVGEGVGASAGVFAGAAIGAAVGPVGAVIGAGIGAIVGGIAGEKIDENINPDPVVTTTTTTTHAVHTTPHTHHVENNLSSVELDNLHKTELHRVPEAAMSNNGSFNSSVPHSSQSAEFSNKRIAEELNDSELNKLNRQGIYKDNI